MAGRFMDKETVAAEAERLGVDLTGLTWPQKQGAVMAAQREEKLKMNEEDDVFSPVVMNVLGEDMVSQIMGFKDIDGDPAEGIPTNSEPVHIHVPYDPMDDMRGKSVLIAPEMAQTTSQLFAYEEDLGEEVSVEEVKYEVDSAYRAGKDEVNGTYNIIGSTGRRVKAMSALPKQGAEIAFKPDEDRVPTVTFQGRKGYLWTHHRLPNIKQLLIESGYYENYRDRFKDEPFVWHAAGKLLCCDIQLAEAVLREIEEKARQARAQQQLNEEFIRKQLGE